MSVHDKQYAGLLGRFLKRKLAWAGLHKGQVIIVWGGMHALCWTKAL